MDSIEFNKKLEKHANATTEHKKQLCRFCLEEASKKLDNKNLELFKSLTNVELICTPEYPRSICSLCESQLQSACKFRVSLLAMEQCWSEFFHQDYLQFVRSINISEEHIYDEIFLDIEMDTIDDDTSSNQSFDLSSTPLINSGNHQRPVSTKSTYVKTRNVQVTKDVNNFTLTMTEKNKIAYTSNVFQNEGYQQMLSAQSSQNANIMQNMQIPSYEAIQSFEFEDLSNEAEAVAVSSDNSRMSGKNLTERNHDIVPLSYERVNECLPAENKVRKRNIIRVASKANKIQIKCVVVGDGAVGKTNLILSYLKNKFVAEHIPTASDIYKFDVKVNKRPVQVKLYDTPGQDSLDHLRKLSYPGCNAFLLCFSVVRPETFDSVKNKWAQTFRNTDASLVLVGTQSDLRSNLQTVVNLKKKGLRPVPLSDAWDFAKSIEAKYIETSSRTNAGVKKAFDTAIEYALCAIETKDSEKSSFWKKWICLG